MAWRHTVYLGVYDLADIYESMHRVFHDDRDAYDERPPGCSAGACIVLDQQGRLLGDSAVLSSALWAVGRARGPGISDPAWMRGFDRAQQRFGQAVAGLDADRVGVGDPRDAPPYTGTDLAALLAVAHRCAGIAEVGGLATDRIVIASRQVSARRSAELGNVDFLNSFFLADLDEVKGHVRAGELGPALASYLAPSAPDPRQRTDVVTDQEAVLPQTGAGRIPPGRWPAEPTHPLALSQQFAVNQALWELGGSAGLLGVNGPPGTGKTTMLRDLLAGNVVERARRLADLSRAEEAFTQVRHRWQGDGHRREVPGLVPSLTGYEMVVASANNAAVENVSEQIPGTSAIAERWRGEADYYADLASALLERQTAEHTDSDPVPEPGDTDVPGSSPTEATSGHPASERNPGLRAWGLVAARLGRRSYRSAFRDTFWFQGWDADAKDAVEGVAPGMFVRLRDWAARPPVRSWARSRQAFRAAERRVTDLVEERRQAERRLAEEVRLRELLDSLPGRIDVLATEVTGLRRQVQQHEERVREAESAYRLAKERHDRHLAARPGLWETILTVGRSVTAWRDGLAPVADALTSAEEPRAAGRRYADLLRLASADAEDRYHAAVRELDDARHDHAVAVEGCAADAERYGAAYPSPEWTGDARERYSQWLTPDLDVARSELFLAALELHRDFLRVTAAKAQQWLRAATEVVAGVHPPELGVDQVRAAWQFFFLVVPMVSTTFASAGRMLDQVGREGIGWLFVDEAGQAAPQYAAAAIWRARRVVVVGDPLQLEPVVTIPRKALRDIAHTYGVDDTWIPPMASVQTLADRVARFGTTLTQGDVRTWVSAPLRIHRRCDEPMFTISNELAYDGMMVNAVDRSSEELARFDGPDPPRARVAVSYWADVPATTAGTHLQRDQIDQLRDVIDTVKAQGVQNSEIIAIAPFRVVALELEEVAKEYPGLRGGTIHTAQGREAPVVVLVLGGDPRKEGARRWAAATPNLVNVAVSRAQRRLYVIGDRDAWRRHRYFRELAAALGDWQADRTPHLGGPGRSAGAAG